MDKDSCRIWIGGLPENVHEEDIAKEYDGFGKIEHIQIRFNSGKTAFAFVQYSERADAEEAVKQTDQGKLFGMPFIKVAWAGQRAPKGKGKSGRSPRRRSPSRRRSRSRRRSPSRRRSNSRRRSPSRRGRSSSRRRSPPPWRRSPSPRRSPSRRPPSRPQSRSPRRPSPETGRADRGSRSPRRQSHGRQPPPSQVQGKYRVIVENLPRDMDWKELKDLGVMFAKVGQCSFARTNSNRSGEIEYTHLEDMEKAIKELDKRRFSGSDERLIAYEQRR